ncbi:MAG: PD-(D/E)XK nuclease family protein [Candidatus Wildermuthbacteria bacterium]|nr:PD-(D/E)XK nuclease family protein [Candidatus Wildermuthbacteria bacterium]
MKQVSFTQLMTYVRCPEHFLFRYVLGMKRPPKKIMKHGFALHETFAYHFDQKKQDSKGLKPSEAKEFFAEVFQSALEDYETEMEQGKSLLTKEYLAKEKETDVAELLVLGLKGIDVYFRQLNPKIRPDLVEEAFTFPGGKGIEVIGRIDLTDKHNVIHELKTTRHTPPKQDVQTDPQVSIYQMAFENIKKRPPAGISKDYLVLSKREPKIVQFAVSRPRFDKKTMLRNIAAIMEAVRHNVFYCLHPAESWICSKEWCPYYKAHQELKKLGLQKFIEKHSR